MTAPDEPVAGEAAPKLKGFDDFESSLGDIMRGERATLGKSLLDVQRDLKIKAAYISAIENSDPSAFETQGFVAGYVRSYARYLGMDPEWTFDTFCKESGFSTAHGMSSNASDIKPEDGSRKRVVKGSPDPFVNPNAPYLPTPESAFSEIEPRAVASLAVLLVLVGGLAYGGYSVLQEVQKVRVAPIEQAPGLANTVDPLAPTQGAITDTGVDVAIAPPPPSAEALDRLYRPEALDLPVLTARDGPIAALDPSQVGALAGLSLQSPSIDTSSPEALPQIAPEDGGREIVVATAPEAVGESDAEAAPVQVVEETPPEVVLFAVRPAWVRVQAADGTVLFEKILDAGERYTVPTTEEPARLRAGNSGSVYFDVGGETYGPAGSSARVAKDIALGVSDVQEKYQIADVEGDPVLKRVVEVAQAARAAEEAATD